jgi:hypothetical protein
METRRKFGLWEVKHTNMWAVESIPNSAKIANDIYIDGDNIFVAGWQLEVVEEIPYVEKWTPAIIYYK